MGREASIEGKPQTEQEIESAKSDSGTAGLVWWGAGKEMKACCGAPLRSSAQTAPNPTKASGCQLLHFFASGLSVAVRDPFSTYSRQEEPGK